MRHDERQRALLLRAYVDEMDIDAVDLRDELRQRVESRLHLAPIVVRPPILHELLDGFQSHALRLIGDDLAIRPARCLQTVAQVDKRVLGDVDVEGANFVALGCRGGVYRQETGRTRGRNAYRRGGEKLPTVLTSLKSGCHLTRLIDEIFHDVCSCCRCAGVSPC